MSLFPCPDCLCDISTEANKCPHCGRNIKQLDVLSHIGKMRGTTAAKVLETEYKNRGMLGKTDDGLPRGPSQKDIIKKYKKNNWYCSQDEKKLWGVCAGIAHKTQQPLDTIRKYFLLSCFFGGPILYLIFALLFKQVNTLNDEGSIRSTDF